MKRHEQTAVYLQNQLALKMFGKHDEQDEKTDSQLPLTVDAHNEMVKKNVEIMKRLIDCVCFLGNQGLSFQAQDKSESSLN